MKLDRFNIEKNIKLCASVIFYYQDSIELVPLTLSDLGPLKKCNCDDHHVVTIDYQCSNCKNAAYQDPAVKQEIRHLRINDNARIMVYMLDILSNLQKRRSDQVIKIIEKTFLESYTEKVFDPLKPTFDLIHFIIFNLVEDYDVVKLMQIFIDFMKKSLKVDMNQTEILMLYLLKDNLILSTEKGQVYDYQNTASIYKRQICTNGEYSGDKKMLVRYLSLTTCFLSREPQISEELVSEFASEINGMWRGIMKLPNSMIQHLIEFPLYFTQSASLISKKIAEHAANSNISSDISGLIYSFSKISHSTNSWKVDFESILRKSQAFCIIKKKLDISFKELFGIIYLMKGDTSNDCFEKTINLILKKDNLQDHKKSVDNLITLYSSKNRVRIKNSLMIFKKYCVGGEPQFTFLNKIFGHFKGIIVDDEQLRLSFDAFYDTLPSKRAESDSKLKSIFLECIGKKNLSKYRAFKENMLYSAKNKRYTKMAPKEELVSLLNIVEFFFELNFGTDIKEIVRKFKNFLPEYESNSLFNVSVKLLKTITGFKLSNQNVTNDRLKESFNLLGEIMIGRPNDFEQLWNLIYSADYAAKLAALNYFVETDKLTIGLDNNRFKHHVIYIDKRVSFMKNQTKYITNFCQDSKYQQYQFGMLVIKRLCMKNLVITKSEVNLLLSSIITKKNPSAKRNVDRHSNDHRKYSLDNLEWDEDTNNKEDNNALKRSESIKGGKNSDYVTEMENTKLTRFYAALMDFVVNQEGEQLGNYFLDEHDEPMLKSLALSRYSNSTNEIINRIFEQLVKNGHIKLCSLLYFFYIVIGLIQRRKINLRHILDQEISNWIKVKPEFLEFIELYKDRKHSNMVDTIYKIQNRILYNLYSDKEIQKLAGALDTVLTRDFYQNIESIIKGEQHTLPYLAELFKIPLKKLRFIYTLTKLKMHKKLENASEQFMSNQDIIKILEMQSVSPNELVLLMKICMNEIDYDSITDLLRLMKLDQVIIPEILINLLLLDLRVEKKPISIKEFNKSLLVHSAIFDRLKQKKEVCWAYCRVLKGDFLIFTELLDLLNHGYRPQNHRLFSRIITGLIGVKNYIHYEEKALYGVLVSGVNYYKNHVNNYFSKYRTEDEKECSLEYAQYLLYNCPQGFKLHPFYELICTVFNDEHIANNLVDTTRGLKKLPFFKDANVFHFVVIYNLVNAEETVIEFIYDFAFFRNILELLRNLKSKCSPDASETPLLKEINDLVAFYEQLVNQYKQIMKKMILEKKLIFQYEHFSKKMCRIFQGFFMSVCNTTSYVQDCDYYLSLNTNLFQVWKQDLHKRCDPASGNTDDKEKVHKLTKKIEDLFRDMKLLKDPFDMFVTRESAVTKQYWETEFTELDYLDDYLESFADHFMRTLEEVETTFGNYKILKENDITEYTVEPESTNTLPGEAEEEVEPEIQDDASSTQEEANMNKYSQVINLNSKEEVKRNQDQLTIQWSGLAVYTLLQRLRKYQHLSSEDKIEKSQEIIYKSNILFGIIEKSLFFYRAGESFTKYTYMSEFNLSIGIRMPSKAWMKFAGSLFMPELSAYTKDVHWNTFNHLMRYLDIPRDDEHEQILAKCLTVKEVYQNDRDVFRNKGIFSQFLYPPAENGSQSASKAIVNDYINLFATKLDIAEISDVRMGVTTKQETNQILLSGYYTLQFYANIKYRKLNSDERIKKLESLVVERIKELKSGDSEENPTVTSLKLLQNDYYDFHTDDKEQKELALLRALDIYTSKGNGKTGNPQKKDGGKDIKDILKSITISLHRLDHFHINFLNDMALSKYSVLSETKNIFTDDIDLATYQKIYESILHLHSSKRMFDRQLLINSLKTLSPYLSSNVHNLNLILEFILEPNANDKSVRCEEALHGSTDYKDRDHFLFRELGLKNQSFYHIFLLHKYPNKIRTY